MSIEDPRIDTIISNYRILSRLGEGGMGVVYKAQDIKLKRVVALKFMPTNLLLDEQIKARFVQEAQAASALDHHCIGTIYQIDETLEGEMFIAMAYYDGVTLRDKIAAGKLDIPSAVNIVRQIAQGLTAAHAKNIVHRDIKPPNIIFTEDGFIKIVDFGLAKLGDNTRITVPGTSMGTPGYMSPEQVKGIEVDHRCDVWAMVVILYEMLTGSLPFKGLNRNSMLYNIVNESPTPLVEYNSALPDVFQNFFNKGLHKDIDQRHASAAELMKELDSLPLTPRPNEEDVPTMIVPMVQQKKQTEAPTVVQPVKPPVKKIRTKPPTPPSAPPKPSKFPVIGVAAGVILVIVVAISSFVMKPKPDSGGKAYLRIDSRPQGAAIFINGSATGHKTLALVGPLELGKYEITLHLADFGDITKQIDLQNADTSRMSITLIPAKKTTAKTNGTGKPAGGNTRTTEGNGHPPKQRPPAIKPTFAELTVTSRPSSASISVDGVLSGHQTPHTFPNMPLGSHTIKVTLPGFFSQAKTTDISASRSNLLDFALKAEEKAKLSISAVTFDGGLEMTASAFIWINGEKVGQTPIIAHLLPAGEYTIRANLFPYTPPTPQRIVLQSGDSRSLKFEFKK